MSEDELILITPGDRFTIRYNRDMDRIYNIGGAIYIEKTRRDDGTTKSFLLADYNVRDLAEDMILIINEMPSGSISAKIADPNSVTDIGVLRRLSRTIRELKETEGQ